MDPTMTVSTPEPSGLTLGEALGEVLSIEHRTASLLQRTVGMTWMLWALVNAGLFVTYDAIGLSGPVGVSAYVENGLAWLPWVALGSLTTTVLWRSLAIAVPPSPHGARWVTATAAVTFLALVLGGLAVIALAHLPVSGPAWALFAVGVAAAVVGGSGLTTLARSEQVLWLVGGIGLSVLAVGVELVAASVGFDALGLMLVLGPVASTALLFGGGLYAAAR
jgi:hypothetical protein